MKSLDPRVVWLWRVQGLLRLLTLWVPLSVGLGVAVSRASSPAVGVLAGATLGLVQVVLALVWPSLEYERFQYAIRERDLLVQSGVLFQRRSSVPHNRIQHVDTRQGPVERAFGLSQVVVYTASGLSSDGSIPGLAEEAAEALRDELARLGGDDGV